MRGLPRLEAEEARETVRSVLAGTGRLKKGEFDAFMDDLDARASGRGSDLRKATRARSKEEFVALIGGLGESGFKVDIRD